MSGVEDSAARGRYWGFPECCCDQWWSEYTQFHDGPASAATPWAKRGVKVVDGGLVPHEPIYSAYIPCDECRQKDELGREFFDLLSDESIEAYAAYTREIESRRGTRTQETCA